MPLTCRRRVEFRDTDAAGIAHFSAFFFWMESAEHELLRAAGVAANFASTSGGMGTASGFPPGCITLLLVAVAAVAAVAGGILGLAIGPAWSAALRAALARAWTAEVSPGGSAVFTPPALSVQPLATGATAAVLVSLAAVAAAAWRTARLAPLAVLRGGEPDAATRGSRRGGRHVVAVTLTIAALIASLASAVAGVRADAVTATVAFFGVGEPLVDDDLVGPRRGQGGSGRIDECAGGQRGVVDAEHGRVGDGSSWRAAAGFFGSQPHREEGQRASATDRAEDRLGRAVDLGRQEQPSAGEPQPGSVP